MNIARWRWWLRGRIQVIWHDQSNTSFALQKWFAYFHIHIHNHLPDIPHLAFSILQFSQRHILMFLSRFGFSMIKIKRPKLGHKNEINKVDLSETIKPIAIGMWIQGWPLLTESSVVSRWGEGGKWGKEILPLFYFYLGRNLGSKIAWHARGPPRRVKMS